MTQAATAIYHLKSSSRAAIANRRRANHQGGKSKDEGAERRLNGELSRHCRKLLLRSATLLLPQASAVRHRANYRHCKMPPQET
eukprot:CAMPEP_0194309314 /NCGR_PEP_ID=MMETSP0171-20130528/6293_1 /TAXON_ID=218684 /ORGANISM="Corethron pennatum, Strain L29A3" /LENGTH=83 /DNA_ID=CAMNT_0039062435 /DNA_START=203 /DNA_END=454 /DNA_ORIENTATION=+